MTYFRTIGATEEVAGVFVSDERKVRSQIAKVIICLVMATGALVAIFKAFA